MFEMRIQAGVTRDLEDHIEDKHESMVKAHESLGYHDGALLKLKIKAILNFAGADGKKDQLINHVSKFAKTLENMENPASLGIWKVGGEIDYVGT